MEETQALDAPADLDVIAEEDDDIIEVRLGRHKGLIPADIG
jgi:hypothetical protein